MIEVYKKLTEQIKKHDHIFIIAHKNIDLDAFGSAIALYKVLKEFEKECYIVTSITEENTSILKAYDHLKRNHVEISFVNEENYRNYITEQSMLIVLDTHRKEMAESITIFDEIKDVMVFDHHIKNNGVIENTICTYINAHLSSMIEFMVGYLKYLNKVVSPVVATIMLAGIEVDTNAFNTKTDIGTYEAAAFLARLGADNIIKQELLQENKKIYMKRQKLISNSFHVNNDFEICVLDDKIYERKDLAIIAEELLKFEDVEASFAIGKTGTHTIGISARSLGRENVEKYMSLLGGGGHTTDAAVQLYSQNLKEVEQLLLNTFERS